MAAPHIAGIAALYFGERPNALPSEIKSAMMTTAYDTVDDANAAVTDPFAQGAGHVDPTRFFEPGLLYLNDLSDWLSYINGIGYTTNPPADPIDPSNLNIASIAIGSLTAPETITRTVTATEAGTFEASVQGMEGFDVVVTPQSFTIADGATQEFTVSITRTTAPLDEFTTGSLTWTSGQTTVRSPIAVQPVTIEAPFDAFGTGVNGSVDIAVTPGGDEDIPLSTTGLSLGETFVETGESGDLAQYEVNVPADTQFARFDVNAADDANDFDLTVYRLNAGGVPVEGWQSASESADERVDLEAPTAGTYLVLVDFFTAPAGSEVTTTVTSVVPGGAGIGLDPAVLPAEQGVETTYTASWAFLAPESTYLGLIYYAETGMYTVLQVDTGEAAAPTVDRLEGASRYDTAIAVSQAAFPGDAPEVGTVYLAGGADFPDALSAAPAAVKNGGPLLLTPTAALLPAVATELTRLSPARIVVVGGTGIVSANVLAQVEALGFPTERIGGANRYETSRNIINDAWEGETVSSVYVATGVDFPDALSAGAAAGSMGVPVVLVPLTGGVDAATTALLEALAPTVVKIAGGTGVVSAATATALGNIAGVDTVDRFNGANRYETSQLINRDAYSGTPTSTAYLATGLDFPDGLAGAALAGMQGAPLYTVQRTCVPFATLNDMAMLGVTEIWLLGGSGVLTAGVENLTACP
jgi:putative cell wall-binding protein